MLYSTIIFMTFPVSFKGQRRIRGYWKNYFEGTDFLVSAKGDQGGKKMSLHLLLFTPTQIFVIDSSDKKRFSEAKEVSSRNH